MSLGKHHFDFEIGEAFFADLSYAEVTQGKVKVGLEIDKQENMLHFHFDIDGTLEVPCDRCADAFDIGIEGTNELFIKYGEEYLEESEDVLVITKDQHLFDIRHLLYEYIVLLLPYKRVHPDDEHGSPTCNPQVLELLKAHQAPEEIDPRWEALKKLKDKE